MTPIHAKLQLKPKAIPDGGYEVLAVVCQAILFQRQWSMACVTLVYQALGSLSQSQCI